MSARRDDDDDDDVRDLSVRKGASAATSTQRSSSSSSSAKNKTLVFLVRVCMWGVLVLLFGRSRSAESIATPREHTGYILAPLVRHSYITCCAPEESTNPSLTARTASTPLR